MSTVRSPAFLRRLRLRRPSAAGEADSLHEEPLLRTALLGPAQMAEHARGLARAHETAPAPGREQLLGRLAANERLIRDAYRVTAGASRRGHRLPPAGEWFLERRAYRRAAWRRIR